MLDLLLKIAKSLVGRERFVMRGLLARGKQMPVEDRESPR
jgi:hypothetical protein